MVFIAQAGFDLSGGGQADPVAGAAEFSMDGADKSDIPCESWDVAVGGGAVPTDFFHLFDGSIVFPEFL